MTAALRLLERGCRVSVYETSTPPGRQGWFFSRMRTLWIEYVPYLPGLVSEHIMAGGRIRHT